MLLFGVADELADGLVCLAERQAFADEVVGEVGGERVVLGRGGGSTRGVDGDAREHRGHDFERRQERRFGVEERGLVLLQIAVIGEGQAFQRNEHADEGADGAAGAAARELGDVGVLLLRHDAGAGGKGIGQRDEAELRGGPEHQLLGEARDVDHREGRGAEVVDDEVAV